MAPADEEFDVEAARAEAVAAVAVDPDHRVSLTDEHNVACAHGDAEHGSNDEDQMAVDPPDPADEPEDGFLDPDEEA